MTSLKTSLSGLTLIKPDPELHAPITLTWFNSTYGKETLLLMGNPESAIQSPTLANEKLILQELVDLEKENKQLSWMMEYDQRIIGVAWIELQKNHGVLPPSIHLMIGDKDYRGKGMGRAAAQALIEQIEESLDSSNIYSRHLVSNLAVANLLRKLGFGNDGEAYTDEDGLEWQNVKRSV